MTDQREKRGSAREKNRLQRDRENALNRLLRDEIPARPEEGSPAQEIMRPEARCENRLRLQIRNRKDSWTEDCRDAGLIRVGRAPENNVVIDSRCCSRRQFEVFVKNDGYYLRNLSRTNPTVVFHEGKRLSPGEEAVKLCDGDRIRAGDTHILADIIWERAF